MSQYIDLPVGNGVTSLNGLTGALTLVAGSGITITPAGSTITISSTGITSAITSINGDTTAAQTLSVGTAGTDFAIVDAGGGSHVFNLPTASATNRGALSSADWTTFNNKGSGTVTSVALSAPGLIYSVSGSPVTTSGTLTLNLLTQTANTVLAGPTTGSAAAPTFRTLVSADLPNNSLTTKTANYTITSADSVILVDTTGGAFTLTLPNPSTVGSATSTKIFRIVDIGGTLSTNGLTLARFGAEKIEGVAASKVFITNWAGWQILTNGTDWFIL